jgi:hypothetical protein
MASVRPDGSSDRVLATDPSEARLASDDLIPVHQREHILEDPHQHVVVDTVHRDQGGRANGRVDLVEAAVSGEGGVQGAGGLVERQAAGVTDGGAVRPICG